MNYYEVSPATNKYQGESALTYSHVGTLKKRQIVEVKVRNVVCLAVVEKQVPKPEFKTNKIEKEIKGLYLSDNQLELFRFLREYYPDNIGSTMKLFVPSYLAKYDKDKKINNPSANIDPLKPQLNKEQLKTYKEISDKPPGTFVLNGVTGSGKTRIYLELARDQINSGKSVMILTPEIALTAPMEQEFKKTFKDIVFTNHSNLTPNQKLKLHQDIYQANRPIVVIGPRSSLFMPIDDLGLIIVDEFHETSYKQESSPRYFANRVASKLSQITKSKLVFGSATPPLTDYYIAEQKNVTILDINTSAITNKRPQMHQMVVDLSDENEQTSYPLLGKTSLDEISKSIKNNEQVLVYINKRGSFRSILCKQCGWQFKCPSCDLPLIYHQDIHLAICHTCGHKTKAPTSCESCGSMDVFFTSPGTKSIADTLAKVFPTARIRRYDKDNKKSERIESNFQSISTGDVDIIVGTQMIAKGFDLPKLSLVVMLITEGALNFPDYTSNERSYQLIKQLAGRVNRGHRKGKVILQTFNPKSEVIDYSKKDWVDFYREELLKRKSLDFPPFSSALKIQAEHRDRTKVEKTLVDIASQLSTDYRNITILGPSPSFIEKKLGKFHWQLIVMSKNRKVLVEITKSLPKTLKKDLDPINFL